MKAKPASWIIFVFFFLFGIVGCSKPVQEVVLGFSPVENALKVEANGNALARILKQKTRIDLKTYVAPDFKVLIDSLKSGKVHLAFLPPYALVEAERLAEAKVLLKAIRRGNPHFYSAIITSKNFKKIEDLKGKTIAWTDPLSASGHVIPRLFFLDQKMDPEKFFGKQVFVGGNDALVQAVAGGLVDAGATFANDAQGKEGAWTQFLKGQKNANSIRVLKVSGPIPGDTFSTTESFYSQNKELVDVIVATLMELGHSKQGTEVLRELYAIDSMVTASKEEYSSLRAAGERIRSK